MSKTSTNRSKIGKSARLAGKRAERELEKLLLSWGLEVSRVAMSGALKDTNLVGDKGLYKGDLKLMVGNKIYDIESKRHANIKAYYDRKNQHIENFCVIVDEIDFLRHMNLEELELYLQPDKRLKRLHGFFEQDDSDIVAMKVNYKPWLFAVKEDTWEELRGVLKE
jgi:hypothetical protein